MAVDVKSPQWSFGVDGARISYLVPSAEAARRLCDDFKPGKEYELEVKIKRKRRSLDANALMWVLLGEIAARLHGATAQELYRAYIQDTPNFVIAEVWEDDFQRMADTWASNGIGWIAEKTDVLEESGGMQKYLVRLFYGSSQYDSVQMARLIDNVLQDAAALGIDTTSDSFRALIEQYPRGQK